MFNVCVTGLHKLTTYMLSTCVIGCNTHEQKQVVANLNFKYTNKYINFTVTYTASGNSLLRNRKLSLLQTENLLPLTLCSHFCILSIVKIGRKPEDAMLLKGSKKIIT